MRHSRRGIQGNSYSAAWTRVFGINHMYMRGLLLLTALCGGAHGHRLLVPSRRQALQTASACAAAFAATPAPARAAAKGGVQWSLELPDSFSVQTQLSSIVRIRVATMLEANDATTGATIKLLLLPFGQQSGGSLTADEQLSVASHFFDKRVDAAAGPESVAATMAASVARSPTIASLSREGVAQGFEAADGARYVRFGYKSARCSEALDDGECFGSLSKRRTVATVAMSSLSQFRTNTERERMQAEGRTRQVQVLWLLTLTAPESAWPRVESTLEGVATSFRVPLEPLPTSA